MIPDPLHRRIRVPVRITGNTIQPIDGSQLPELKADAEAQLVFEASELKDPTAARELTAETVVTVLATNSRIFFGVSPQMVGEARRPAGLIEPQPLGAASGYWLVEAIIKEDLKMLDRRNKKPTLLGCNCEIPLLKQEAVSLNHAFTVVSTALETRRRSHTGNVFERTFTYDGEFFWPLRQICDNARNQLTTSVDPSNSPK